MGRHLNDNRRGDTARPPGFTLVELLAVIALILVVLGIAVPAFRGMLNASEQSLAENTLRVGVTVARDLAVHGDADTGLMVVRDPGGKTRLVPVVHVGTVVDAVLSPASTGTFNPLTDPAIERDVFAPIPLTSPFELPEGYTVAGFADPNTIDRCFQNCDGSQGPADHDGWYDSEAYGDNGSQSTSALDARLDGNWVLPETWMYERVMQAAGVSPPDDYTPVVTGAENVNRTPRQSFMIRFESATGLLVRDSGPAVVVDARPSALGRSSSMFTAHMRWARADRIDDARAWAERVLKTADLDGEDGVTIADETRRVLIIGNFSNDTVLAGPVGRVALLRDADLARGLGAGGSGPAGQNVLTGSIYRPLEEAGRIGFDMALFAGHPGLYQDQGDVRLGITRWIQGDTNFVDIGSFESDGDEDPSGNIYGDLAGDYPADEPRALIYFVHPATGELTEVQR